MPKISVVVTCYNQAAYINECLESVLRQSFTDWECIIVNDGSTDDSLAVAQKWQESDDRFIILSLINAGVCNARNKGIEIAKGSYILPLDADDYIDLNYLERALNIFDNYTKCKVVYGKAMLTGMKSGLWDLPAFSLKNLARSNCIYVTAMYKKEDWQRIGGYDLNMHLGLEDWEFWIHLLKNDPEVHFINEVCFHYRILKESRNTAVDTSKIDIIQAYITNKHIDFYINTFGTYQSMLTNLKHQNMELNSLKKSWLYTVFLSWNRFKKQLKTFKN